MEFNILCVHKSVIMSTKVYFAFWLLHAFSTSIPFLEKLCNNIYNLRAKLKLDMKKETVLT